MQKIFIILACCCLCMQATAQTNIVQAEYYIDNDPGFGSGTNIPVTPAVNIIDNNFAVSLVSIPQGMHAVFVRSKNASGNWSLTNSLFFYKLASTVTVANITKAEYYFDNDPGFGFATNIPVTAGTDLPNISLTASINSLAVGIHILNIRSLNANGNWSVTNQLVFYKNDPTGATTNITKAEYYFDNDPGFGDGTDIPVSAGPDLQNINFTASLNFLSVGIHILNVRSLDANGKWSVTNQLVYYKNDPMGTATSITKAEYFFDYDPGFGYGEDIPVTPGTDLQNINFTAGISVLPVGIHILNVRSLDANGNWSVTNQLVYYKADPTPAAAIITEAEYFYDTDPGFGEGIPVVLNPTTDLADYLLPVNITGLSTGDHILFLRSRSSEAWSVTNMYTFTIGTTATTPFININSITTTTNCAWANFRISFHATGNYLPNNIFTVQLSDATGSFASPINVGQVTSQISSEVNCMLPSHMTESSGYQVRVLSSNTAVTGVPSISPFIIHDRPNLGNDTTVFIVCANETLDLLPVYNTVGLLSSWNIITPTLAPVGNYQLIVTSIYGCIDSAIVIVKQDVSTWTGAISSNWHVAGNWNTGKVPTEKTHVIVTAGAVNICEIITADAFAASVQVKAPGNIRVINNHKLLISAHCDPLPAGL
ncbi:MAG: hypothetical protein ABI741_07780 [Ferruginibacter sp.]